MNSFLACVVLLLVASALEVRSQENTGVKQRATIQRLKQQRLQQQQQQQQKVDADLVVTTRSGRIRGNRETIMETQVDAFLGIPYARPPVGQLRFSRPEPVDPWRNVLPATKPPRSCMQEVNDAYPDFYGDNKWYPTTELHENCLYLNIWTPTEIRRNKTEKTTVLVWFHAGAFRAGSSSLDIYNGAILSSNQSVVVVTVNYRLGAFGFLYLGIPEAPGNLGLFDQVSALQWVKLNIDNFGGDPESIVLFGSDAGAASIHAHLLSPISRGLFKRAIVSSGTLDANWAFQNPETAKANVFALAETLNCRREIDIETLNCLRAVPAERLIREQEKRDLFTEFSFIPTLDGELITSDPRDTVKASAINKDVSVMIGTVLHEGTTYLLSNFRDTFTIDGPNFVNRTLFETVLKKLFKGNNSLEQEAIRYVYTDWEDPESGEINREIIADLVGDVYYVCPSNRLAQQLSQLGTDVFYYYFTHRPISSPWGTWMGVVHGDEVEYLFGTLLLDKGQHNDQGEVEKSFAVRAVDHFMAFAKKGTPSTEETTWPVYTEEEPFYLLLHGEEQGAGRGPRPRECAFWNSFLPLLRTRTDGCVEIQHGSTSPQPDAIVDQTTTVAPDDYDDAYDEVEPVQTQQQNRIQSKKSPRRP